MKFGKFGKIRKVGTTKMEFVIVRGARFTGAVCVGLIIPLHSGYAGGTSTIAQWECTGTTSGLLIQIVAQSEAKPQVLF